MATEKQIAANRQNALSSTGPRTGDGKRRSRRNALRHGLTAETVIDVLEDAKAYKALQRRIYADYRPSSNFELELVARLVSLLWRLRRAVAIESGLLSIEAKAARKHLTNRHPPSDRLKIFYALSPSLVSSHLHSNQTDLNVTPLNTAQATTKENYNCELAGSFLKASRLDKSVFERLGRYETRLWRQTPQLDKRRFKSPKSQEDRLAVSVYNVAAIFDIRNIKPSRHQTRIAFWPKADIWPDQHVSSVCVQLSHKDSR